MAATNGNPKPHAIMVSFHLQGHITPFLNLAIKLASKGFTVTFAHLEHIHHQISNSQKTPTEPDIFAGARISGLDIRYTTFNDGFPLDFDRSANFDLHLENFLLRFPDKVDELVAKIIHSNSPADFNYFLIADTLSVWPSKIAKKYGLVNVSFWTEPALVFSLYYHLQLLRDNGHVPVNGRYETVNYVPGIPSINTRDFMSFLHDSDLKLLHNIMFKAFEEVRSAELILCNTVEELEAEAISALQEQGPFYAIGPLFPDNFSESPIPRSLLRESDSTEWLNSRPNGSVLYVSFGSIAKIDKSVIAEIAGGLITSGVNFIWVLRPGIVESANDDGLLPKGFEDGMRERGLIVPWCNQNEVLLNPAIGGFLTHCGWNSVLESMWCGVPMIAYPLFTDQITNRKLVVDDWRVGINLCDGKCITKNEVAEKIRVLMGSKGLKREAEKLRNILRKAVTKGGSSERNFDRFVEDVSSKLLKTCIM